MRLKSNLVKVLLLALALTLIPVTAVSAPKVTPGSTCKVLNQRVVYLNKTYTCVKSGKKLVWNKGVVVKQSTPTPTPSTSVSNFDNNVYMEPKMTGSPIEKCKIKENSIEGSKNGNLASGFPFVSRFASYPK